MQFLGKLEQKQMRFSHGGCEVLHLHGDVPTGSTPAAIHFARIIQNLCVYAEKIYFPEAADALADAAQAGQAYRFARRHYRLELTEAPAGRWHRVTLTATLSALDPRSGVQILSFHTLETLWDAAGEFQLDGKRHSARQGAQKSKKSRKKKKDGERDKKTPKDVA